MTRADRDRQCVDTGGLGEGECFVGAGAGAGCVDAVLPADLADLGLDESPRVGEILAELRRRKLNGELDGRDSELAAARELIAG